jgi:predicted deacylase
VLVVGGTHGNEASGARAVRILAAGPPPRTGVLVLVPEANPEALAARTRTAPIRTPGVPSADLNRIYPGTGSEPEAPRAAAIFALARGADLVLDLHEEGGAWTEADEPTLVIAPPAASFALELLETLANRKPAFTFTGGSPAGSLTGTAGDAGIRAMTVEIPVRLPFPERVELQLRVVEAALAQLGMR